ncbi:MAG: bacterial transcriptional activator domain-containing protein, partial [Rhodobiaceae bacterium]|nr:bacterial transcriptional activator domain-containing protein [Rhodobiaceae bacterium]
DADWTLAERERIANIRIRGMIALMHWHGDNRTYEDALEIGRRLLTEDPFREAVQIDMMWLYVLNGQRAQAIRQYDAFSVVLREELGIEPMPETRALYDHIRTGLDCAMTPPSGVLPGGEDRRATLSAMLAALERSRRDVYQTLRNQIA